MCVLWQRLELREHSLDRRELGIAGMGQSDHLGLNLQLVQIELCRFSRGRAEVKSERVTGDGFDAQSAGLPASFSVGLGLARFAPSLARNVGTTNVLHVVSSCLIAEQKWWPFFPRSHFLKQGRKKSAFCAPKKGRRGERKSIGPHQFQ